MWGRAFWLTSCPETVDILIPHLYTLVQSGDKRVVADKGVTHLSLNNKTHFDVKAQIDFEVIIFVHAQLNWA